MIHKKVASRYLQSYSPPASELPGVQTLVTQDSQKNLPGDTGKPSKDQDKSRPSNPEHRERVLPLPNELTDGRVRHTPGNGSYNGPSHADPHKGDKVPVRTTGIPGEQYGHPYSDSTPLGRRPKNSFRLFPSTLERQKDQRGDAKLVSKKWYDKNKGPHKAKAKRRYEKEKRNPNFKRRQKYYQEYPKKYERLTGGGVIDPAERSKEWREKNKGQKKGDQMERESTSRQKWRSPADRLKSQKAYRKNKHKIRRKAKEYRRKNKSRLKQYRKKVKHLNRKRVGPKPKAKKFSMELRLQNNFPFAFKSKGEYYFGFIKNVDVDEWLVVFYLEKFGTRTWEVDQFLNRAIFHREEDLNEFYDLLDSAVETEFDEPDFEEFEDDDDDDSRYTYVPMEKNADFYRDQTPPQKLDQNNHPDSTGVPRGDVQTHQDRNWVKHYDQPDPSQQERPKKPSEKQDFGFVYNNPGSARVIPEGHGFENKKAALMGEITDRVSRDILDRSKKVRVRFSHYQPNKEVWIFNTNDHQVYLKAHSKEGVDKVADANLSVNCSCGFWKYQGPEYWAKTGGYLIGVLKGKATPPKVKDPSGRNRVCKHVMAVFNEVSRDRSNKYKLASEPASRTKYLPDILFNYKVSSVCSGGVMKSQVNIPKIPGWLLTTQDSNDYVTYTKKYGNHILQVKVTDLFGNPELSGSFKGLVQGHLLVFFEKSPKHIGDLKELPHWLKKFEIQAERYIKDREPGLAKQLKLAEIDMGHKKSDERVGCGSDGDMFAGRKWKGEPQGYGKEYSDKNGPGKWEPASMGPGRHEEECQGYGLGGTKDCYNTKATGGRGKSKIGPVKSDADKKEYNKKYRKKRWPDRYKSASPEVQLRSSLIKLAYENKEIRPAILNLVKGFTNKEAGLYRPGQKVMLTGWGVYPKGPATLVSESGPSTWSPGGYTFRMEESGQEVWVLYEDARKAIR